MFAMLDYKFEMNRIMDSNKVESIVIIKWFSQQTQQSSNISQERQKTHIKAYHASKRNSVEKDHIKNSYIIIYSD